MTKRVFRGSAQSAMNTQPPVLVQNLTNKRINYKIGKTNTGIPFVAITSVEDKPEAVLPDSIPAAAETSLS